MLAHPGVSQEITAQTCDAAAACFAEVVAQLDRSRAGGALRDVSFLFVASLVTGMVDATLNYITQNPEHRDRHADAGLEALWRFLG
ncbi:hypothetical protein [Sphingomonas sp.]|uniref:hypothetical protein n=1 Tax=Sphingomonas sp. TaxID=28214 RepID=UPI003B00E37D